MIFEKSYNNSAALVKDEAGVEWIVIGKGIGFGKKAGDVIEEEKIERRFKNTDQDTTLKTVTSLSSLALSLTNKMVELSQRELGIKFDNYAYTSLADHVDFMLTRSKENLVLDNQMMQWEVIKLYPKEVAVAKELVTMVEKEAKVTLPDSEVVFLTYHLVNVGFDKETVQETMELSKLLDGILRIVSLETGKKLDRTSFNYSRFVTHLRALLIQIIKKQERQNDGLDPIFGQLMKQKYPETSKVVTKIAYFIKEKTGYQLSEDDEVYLILHVWRVSNR
ncbi:PRD domain-containing protein [Lactobacillus jensenii]|uniref:PRD domain-containing protein n=1 Tax=Lactobacillus jensenii TaxID=109790 RepID=UPI00065DDC9E|nr:PRD domain-containing protein [Lactobacillus jensenii]